MATQMEKAAALKLLQEMAVEQGVMLSADRLQALAQPLAALRAGFARLDHLVVGEAEPAMHFRPVGPPRSD